jgi:hypothetical protein
MLVRTIGGALLSVTISAFCAYADEPDFKKLVEIGSKAKPFRDAWEKCTAAVVRRELQSALIAEAVAQQALKSCHAQETRLRSVLKTRVGDRQARTVVEELRRGHEANLITIVDQLRR